MTVKQARELARQKQALALEKLALLCGVIAPVAGILRRMLLTQEITAKAAAIAYANGQITWEERMRICGICAENVQAAFNGKLEGLQAYGEVRGYQLTIDSALLHPVTGKYKDLGLLTNLGGDAPLAYDFNDIT